MPFIEIVYQDWRLFAHVFFDAWLPLWRLVPRSGSRGKSWNVLAVLLFVGILSAVGSFSPHPNASFSLQDTGELSGQGMSPAVLYWQMGAGILTCVLVLVAFGIDLYDALRSDNLDRFVFANGSPPSQNHAAATGVLFLFCGYAFRVWLMGVGSLVALRAANTYSIVRWGQALTIDGCAGLCDFGDVLLASLQSPLESSRTRSDAVGFLPWVVGVLSATRWLVVTLGLGTFYALIPRLAGQPGNSPPKPGAA